MSYSSSVLQQWVLPSLLWPFHLADKGTGPGTPPSEVPKKRNIGISDHHSARTIPYCLTKYVKKLEEYVSFFYPIFKFKCKDNSVQSQATKTRSSVPSKHTFKARPSATGASPPWRHICIYIYGRVKRQKSSQEFFGYIVDAITILRGAFWLDISYFKNSLPVDSLR